MVLPLSLLALQARGVWSPEERVSAVVGPLAGLAVAYLVTRFVRRHPWPRPFRVQFALMHFAAAPVFAAAWFIGARLLAALVLRQPVTVGAYRLAEGVFIGSFFYPIVAGVAYAVEGHARAARAEALAARTQLAALRAQIHPHFLFNALHAVVQLIPVQPARAAEAAELVADLLRTAVEEERDLVPLRDEWRFVSGYLDVERIRFGDRLVVRTDMDGALLDEPVPAFALQTLVENAVRHGAAHRVEPTEVTIAAARASSGLTLTVRNEVAAGSPAAAAGSGACTGLARLRERLGALYGSSARLTAGRVGDAYEAVLVVPHGRA